MEDQGNTPVDPFEEIASLLGKSEDTEDTEDDDLAEDDDAEAPEDDAPDDDEKDAPASEQTRKVKVTVKDGEGNDVEEEVTEDELKAGYQRQRDYTRKTQALADREREAARVFEEREQEVRGQYVQQLQTAYQALNALASIKSPQEMQQLAEDDPGTWVKENARMQQIQSLQGHIASQIQQEAIKAQQENAKLIETAKQEAWQRLTAEGIDRPALEKLYASAGKHYAFLTKERLGNIMDAESVLILRDAVALRELKARKPEVKKQIDASPPASKAQTPVRDKAASEARKAIRKPGGGRLNDLAAYINATRR